MCLDIGRKQRRLRRRFTNIHQWSNEAERRKASIDVTKQGTIELLKRILDLRSERNRNRRDVTKCRRLKKSIV
jgi:hypothetical protein